MSSLVEIGRFLERCERVVVATHKSPDPDAIGSASALGHLLHSLGIEVGLYDQDYCPPHTETLLGSLILTNLLDDVQKLGADDALVIVDCNHPDRVGKDFAEYVQSVAFQHSGCATVVLDHHIVDEPYGQYAWVDTSRASATLVIYDLARASGWDIGVSAARSMYAGLVADTGSFRHGNTDEVALRTASELVGLGANPAEISRMLYQAVPLAQVQLAASVLATLRMGEERPAWASVILTEAMVDALGLEDTDKQRLREDFVDYPRSIENVAIAFQLKERLQEGGTKVSLRSSDPYNVQAIAASFGGGGHRNAAGCFVAAGVEEVHSIMVDAVRNAIRSTPKS